MQQSKARELSLQAEISSDPTFPNSGWNAPHRVRLDGDDLAPDPSSGVHRVYPKRGMLTKFIALADATEPRRFAEYAERWGLLGLCQHGLVAMHAGLVQFPVGALCETYLDPSWEHREPLDAWRRYARQAALIRTAAATSFLLGANRNADDWRKAYPELRDDVDPSTQIAVGISQWLKLGAVRPRLLWSTDADARPASPSLVFDGLGLFGALAVQLMLAVWRNEQISPCRDPGCPNLADMRGRVNLPYCDKHRPAAIGQARSERWRDNHPDYYSNAQRDERAAKPYVTGRRRRATRTRRTDA
jgi:hypothetical protein